MTLREFYDQIPPRSAPRKDFRDAVAKACGVEPITIYRWLSGEVVPEKLKREEVSKIIGLPVEELFPTVEAN
jgi:hypothetical protein